MTKAKETVEDFDLASLDTTVASDAGTEIELKHPISGDGLGIFWGVLGKHSEVFRETMRQRVDRRIKRDTINSRRGKQAEIPTAEQVEAEAVELLVTCSTGWRTGDKRTIKFQSQDLEFNAANATRVLTQMLWVREQVDNGVGDLENFMKG